MLEVVKYLGIGLTVTSLCGACEPPVVAENKLSGQVTEKPSPYLYYSGELYSSERREISGSFTINRINENTFLLTSRYPYDSASGHPMAKAVEFMRSRGCQLKTPNQQPPSPYILILESKEGTSCLPELK